MLCLQPGVSTKGEGKQQQPASQALVKRQRKEGGHAAAHPLDIWGNDGLLDDSQPSTSAPDTDLDPAFLARLARPNNKLSQKQQAKGRKDLKHRGPSAGAATPARALDIDAPGCSFNPEHEAHQVRAVL